VLVVFVSLAFADAALDEVVDGSALEVADLQAVASEGAQLQGPRARAEVADHDGAGSL
jgi:hypothetical protein